jgi:hypothetical protein
VPASPRAPVVAIAIVDAWLAGARVIVFGIAAVIEKCRERLFAAEIFLKS